MTSMTDTQYLAELEKLLASLPPAEKEEALNFVQEYFEEAREHHMENPQQQLGTPFEYAKTIREGLKDSIPPEIPDHAPHEFDCPSNPANQKPQSKLTPGKIGLILLSPLLVIGLFTLGMLVLAAMMLVAALLILLAVLVLSGILGAVLLFYKAVTLLSTTIAGTLFDLGCGLFGLFLAYFAFLLLKAFFMRAIPFLAIQSKRLFVKIKTRLIQTWNQGSQY